MTYGAIDELFFKPNQTPGQINIKPLWAAPHPAFKYAMNFTKRFLVIRGVCPYKCFKNTTVTPLTESV